MIVYTRGNIFNSDAEVLVNPVNCIGVMGKGLALQFDKRYPEVCAIYKREAKAGNIVLGRVFWTGDRDNCIGEKAVIHFPTKQHWRDKSNIIDISWGLWHLKSEVIRFKVLSIAIPPLGCGLGGLDWKDVKPLIEGTFKDLENVKVYLYEP